MVKSAIEPEVILKELIRAFREKKEADERFQQALLSERFKETREIVREALAAIAVFLRRKHGMSIEEANLFISKILSVSV